MSQATTVLPTTGPLSMASYSALANDALAAIQSNFSGSSAPSTTGYPLAYQWWANTGFTPGRMSIYDGSTWLVAGMFDAVNHQWAPTSFPLHPQSTVDLTLALIHANKRVELNMATTGSFTIPASSVVSFPLYTRIKLGQMGAGISSIVASSLGSVTLRSYGGKTKLAGQYAEGEIYQRAVDEWVLSGNLTT